MKAHGNPSADEVEIARLNDQLARAEAELARVNSGYDADMSAWTGRIHRLEVQLAQVIKERDNWHEIVKDDCLSDEEFRKVAGAWDTSDSYGVEPHADILEKVLKELVQTQAREARVRTALEAFVKTFETDFVFDGIIVDEPARLWTPIEGLYLTGKQALTETQEGG